MASTEPGYGTAKARAGAEGVSLLLVAFVSAIFTSAFLLFAVQPMFTKMVLPLLGGSPGVWSVAMVFFQSLLLAGYAYAHVSTRFLSLKLSVLVHLGLFAVTAVTLPLGISAGLGDPPNSGQELWLIGVFMASVGLPFFAVSANGPLLQAWFSKSAHPTANDPYYLYGASNLGSFAALLLYPVLIEPLLTLKGQTGIWSAGFMVLGGLIALAGLTALRHPAVPTAKGESVAGARPTLVDMALWTALSMVPSGLLVAATAHLSTDVAASPFMWVIPLALYLATFMVVFRDPLPFRLTEMEWFATALAGSLVIMMFAGEPYLVLSLLLHLGFLTVATLICHARLYQRRPASAHLTTFYLCMSFGGVLGGLFCGLAAPNLFDSVAEYPILIIAALVCLPSIGTAGKQQWLRQALPWAVAVALAIGFKLLTADSQDSSFRYAVVVLVVLFAGIAMVLYRKPVAAVTLICGVFLLMANVTISTHDLIAARSFFGVNKVQISNDGQFLRLTHGTTLHGAMRLREADGKPAPKRPEPLSYYYDGGPMSQTIKLAQERSGEAGADIGIVGLGTGSLACHGRPQDRWTYFEIDPVVVQIAADPRLFRFLSECAPQARMVLGDARLTLAKQPQLYDVLVIDAFASDAIPVHLLTKEAVEMYMTRLKPDGVLVLHISNRHLELGSVVSALKHSMGIYGVIRFDEITIEHYTKSGHAGSQVAALTRDARAAEALVDGGWRPLLPTDTKLWTDDYSNIVGAMWRAYQAK